MKRLFQKRKMIVTVLAVLAFLVFSLLKIDFLAVKNYNQNNTAFGAEERSIICKKAPAFEAPLIGTIELGDVSFWVSGREYKIASPPNDLEVPIGEATDEAEKTAEEIINHLDEIIAAAQIEIDAAGRMVELANECKEENCGPTCLEWGEDIQGKKICIDFICSGNFCPENTIKEIKDLQKTIEGQVERIENANKEIYKIFFERRNLAIGVVVNSLCMKSLQGQYPGNCGRSDIQLFLEKLEKSRSGNYLLLPEMTLFPGGFLHTRPPGLKDCLTRPTDIEEVFRGEKTALILFSCRNALAGRLISDKETCYGNAFCLSEKEAGVSEEKLKKDYLCPRAENYYCCQ